HAGGNRHFVGTEQSDVLSTVAAAVQQREGAASSVVVDAVDEAVHHQVLGHGVAGLHVQEGRALVVLQVVAADRQLRGHRKRRADVPGINLVRSSVVVVAEVGQLQLDAGKRGAGSDDPGGLVVGVGGTFEAGGDGISLTELEGAGVVVGEAGNHRLAGTAVRAGIAFKTVLQLREIGRAHV